MTGKRVCECRLVDSPNAKPVCFEAPPVVKTGKQLKGLLKALDRQADKLPSLILRLFDEETGGFELLSDDYILPADGLMRIALQRARPNAAPLAACNSSASAEVAAPQPLPPPPRPQVQRPHHVRPSPLGRGGPQPMPPLKRSLRGRDETPAERLGAEGKRTRSSTLADRRPHDTLATSRHASAAAAMQASGSPAPPAYHNSPGPPPPPGEPMADGGAEERLGGGGEWSGVGVDGPSPPGLDRQVSEFFMRQTDVLEYPFSTLGAAGTAGGPIELLLSTSALL